MRRHPHESRSLSLLAMVLILPLAGCTLGATKQAATPPPPKPAAVQPPAPDPPLSVPQTAVTLPDPQPVNPDAIPSAPVAQAPAPEKIEAPAAPRAARRNAASPPKPDESDPPPTPAVQEQAPIRPILTGDEQKRIQATIEGRKREIADRLARAKGRSSSREQSLVDRIKTFLAQCAQAEQRGDYSQADALSERALILARELQGE
jgi:hypothetical protein